MAGDAAVMGGMGDKPQRGERERAWEKVFLRLLSLPRERVYNFSFLVDKDGFPVGGITSEGVVEWWGRDGR